MCSCQLVDAPPRVSPGWGCCACRSYNGMHRKKCYVCGHTPRDFGPLPKAWIICTKCGAAFHPGLMPQSTMAGRRIAPGTCAVEGCGAPLPS